MRWLLVLLAVAAWGQALPKTEVETLAGQKVSMPGVFGGKPAVVVWSFSRKAGDATKAWVEPLAQQGVAVWSAAMLESAPRLVRPMIRAGMRRETPEGRQDRALLLYSGAKMWRGLLRVEKEEEPLVVLVDGRGVVVWRYAGVYDGAAAGTVARRWRELH